jgi:hypothetical protein
MTCIWHVFGAAGQCMEAKQLQQQLEVLSNTSLSVATSINAAVQQEGQLQEKVGAMVHLLEDFHALHRVAHMHLAASSQHTHPPGRSTPMLW